MKTYKETIEHRIPEILETCSKKDWDSYNAEPVSVAAVGKISLLLGRFEKMGIACPDEIYAVPDGDVELIWEWYKGDWKIPVDKQERYEWTMIIAVSENSLDGKGDCLFFEFDVRDGVSKNDPKDFHLYFNCMDGVFPKEMVDKINQLVKWKEEHTGP